MISYETRILSGRTMGLRTAIPPIMTYAAAPEGAHPWWLSDGMPI